MKKSVALLLLVVTVSVLLSFPSIAYAADELIVEYSFGADRIYVKDNHVTLKEGTTPGYTNIYLDSDLNTPLTPPGFHPATATGYDLSNHVIHGAYNSGQLSASTSITMLGGNVRGISGGGGGGSNGDIHIRVMGGRAGSISTTTLWGSSSDRFNGKCIVEISGGYIESSVRCGSHNLSLVKEDCRIVISGGTICGDVWLSYVVPTAERSIVITGGTVRGNITTTDAVQTAPTNGSVPVYKTGLMLPNITEEIGVQSRLSLGGEAARYGRNDMITTNSGELSLYLPAGTAFANTESAYFQADVSVARDPNNAFYAIDAPSVPATGDRATPLFWAAVLLTAGMGLMLSVRKRKA